jgi:hypothetical protein
VGYHPSLPVASLPVSSLPVSTSLYLSLPVSTCLSSLPVSTWAVPDKNIISYLSLLQVPGITAFHIFGVTSSSGAKEIHYLQLAMAPPRTNKESIERALSPLWMNQFEALERFIKKHDRLPYKDEKTALWVWMRTQRKNIKDRGCVRGLLQEKQKLLESIGFFDFESRSNTPRITTAWVANYKILEQSNENYFRDNAVRSWLISQRKEYRKGSLQPTKVKLLDGLPFDWMAISKISGGYPSTQRSPPSSSGRISTLGRSQLATKPTTVVEEALVPPSADPKPAGGDFPPGWMQQSKQRISGRVDHYWISPAGKRFDSQKKASYFAKVSTEKCAGGRASTAARLNTFVSARKDRKGKAADSRPSTVPRRPQTNLIQDRRAKNTRPHNLTKERNQRKVEASSLVEFNSTSPFQSSKSSPMRWRLWWTRRMRKKENN